MRSQSLVILVGGAVAVVALMIVLVPALQADEEQPPAGWVYDEYRADPEAVAASGSLEIVTVEGVRYIHAVDIGEGTITRAGGAVEEVTVAKAVMDLILLTGQSNSMPSVEADPATASPVPPMGRAYFYSSSGSHLIEPMRAADGHLRVGDKAPAWAAVMAERTDHKIAFVFAGKGSMGVEYFQPGNGGWDLIDTRVGGALAAFDHEHFDMGQSVYGWIQGEHDEAMTAEEYRAAFAVVHDAIMSGSLGIYPAGCVLSVVRSGPGVVEAQRTMGEFIPTVHVATNAALGFSAADGTLIGIHYSQAGDNIIGTAMGKTSADLLYGEPEGGGPGWVRLASLLPLLILTSIFVAAVTAARR